MERFAESLHKLGGQTRNVVVIAADSGNLLRTQLFAKDFEERHVNYGKATQNAMTAAAGFALRGKVPFVTMQSRDAVTSSFEIIRNAVCRAHLNVKIIGSDAGFSAGKMGCSYQTFDDVAAMRLLPNMKIICPDSFEQIEDIMQHLLTDFGPTYVRLPGENLEKEEDVRDKFEFGRAQVVGDGNDIAFLTYGSTFKFCKEARLRLRELGILSRVVNMVTIKPLDRDAVIEAAKSCKVLVAVEDHSVVGGLGSAISELLCEEYPRDMFRIGIEDHFGETAKPSDLYKRYGLDGQRIADRVFNWWRELGYH